MNSKEMKFEKYVFGTFLNGYGIAKYTDGEMVKIIAEKDGETNGERVFNTEDEYEEWVDSIVSENDQFYNKANAVNLLLNAIS